MATRTITKALIGAEDIVFGQGTVTQTRVSTNYVISKVNGSRPRWQINNIVIWSYNKNSVFKEINF